MASCSADRLPVPTSLAYVRFSAPLSSSRQAAFGHDIALTFGYDPAEAVEVWRKYKNKADRVPYWYASRSSPIQIRDLSPGDMGAPSASAVSGGSERSASCHPVR
jgi:hypothetical protein